MNFNTNVMGNCNFGAVVTALAYVPNHICFRNRSRLCPLCVGQLFRVVNDSFPTPLLMCLLRLRIMHLFVQFRVIKLIVFQRRYH